MTESGRIVLRGQIIEYNEKECIGKIMTKEGKNYPFDKDSLINLKQKVKTYMTFDFELAKNESVIFTREITARFYNPYNFVRPLPEMKNKFFTRLKPAQHSSYNGLTGIITCNLIINTPLFIGSGSQAKPGEHQMINFFTIDNEPVIPGSSLRGMVRSVYEAITDSCYGVIDQKKYLWRRMSLNDAKGLKAARVVKSKEGLSLEVFDVPEFTDLSDLQEIENREKLHKKPILQSAAWIKRYLPTKKTIYHDNKIDLKGLTHGDEATALLKTVFHRSKPICYWQVVKILANEEEIREAYEHFANNKKYRIVKGFICLTGKNTENKHDERFFFGDKTSYNLNEQLRSNYKEMIQKYKDLNKEKIKKSKEIITENGLSTYDLLNQEDLDISKFMLAENDELQEGDLVYCKIRGDEVIHIVPVYLSRIKYELKPYQFLNERNQPCTQNDNLCPACRVFGWVDSSEDAEKNPLNAYAGNVYFENARLAEITESVKNAGSAEKATEIIDEKTLPELSTPKPTTTFFYLNEQHKRASFIGKNFGYQRGQSLRGRKFYRHHPDANQEGYIAGGSKENKRSSTIFGAFKKGVFTFKVRYQNLTKEELGGLLWCLRLEEGMYHRLGYGKPLGFGSVEIQITELKKYNFKARYKELNNTDNLKIDSVDKYIQFFKNQFETQDETAAGSSGLSGFQNTPTFIELRALLSKPSRYYNYEIHYPRRLVNQSSDDKSYEWFMDAAENASIALPLADRDLGLPYYVPKKER